MKDDDDPLKAARGCAYSLGLGLLLWGIVGFVVWTALH